MTMFAREKVDDAPPRAPISRLNDSRFIIFIVVIIIIVVVVSSASATAASVKRLKHRCRRAKRRVQVNWFATWLVIARLLPRHTSATPNVGNWCRAAATANDVICRQL